MELIISGFGGQGVLTAGLLVIYAGAAQGKRVLWYPSYGSEMRGGTANCSVTISDDEIGSPALTKADVLIALNEPSIDKFKDMVRPGGMIFVNESIVPEYDEYPKEVIVYRVRATDIANELNNPKGANIVMLGALIKVTGLFGYDMFMEEIDKYFAKKGRVNPNNALCLEGGYHAV